MAETRSDAFERMDAMYRYQRYIYDATRKFYLLGRDRLLDRMMIRDGDAVAEIGCGTGRNLRILALRYPNARFFGLDASSEMLEIAAAKNEELSNVSLRTALADSFGHRTTFGLGERFDVIFFSYSISMIPSWRPSIENALSELRPGGSIYIVDFYDQRELPGWFQSALKGWLRQFHVRFWDDLIPYLSGLDRSGIGHLTIESVARRYAFIAQFKKTADL